MTVCTMKANLMRPISLSLPFVLLILSSTRITAGEPPATSGVAPPGIQVGTTAEVKLSGKPGDGSLKVWSSRPGITWDVSEKGDTAKVTAGADAVPGLYWIRFYNQFGATELRPFFVGVIPEIAEAEPNNTLAEAQAIDKPSVLINGVLHKTGEVDIWSVDVPAGKTIVASMQANSKLGSPMDGVLQILDPKGTVVAQNDDDHGFDPLVTWTPETTGRFMVRTFAFPSAPNSTVRLAGAATYVYRLTITTESYVDHVTPMAVSQAQPGKVELHGWNIPDDRRLVEIPSFEQQTAIFNGLANAQEIRNAELSPLVETDALRAIPLQHTVTGRVSREKEKDTYGLPGGKGQKLKVTVACRSVDSLLDPVLIIRAADGKVLKEVDDRSRGDLDCEAVVTLPAEGCTVEVTDRYLKGGDRFFYLLSVSEPVPHITPTLAATKFVVAADKPLEIPVTIGRQNGFAEKVTIILSGLPDSLTCPAVDSPNEGDAAKTAKLQLSLTGKGVPAWSGPVQVRCTWGSGEQLGEASIPSFKATTSTIWVSHPEVAAESEEAKADAEAKTEKPTG